MINGMYAIANLETFFLLWKPLVGFNNFSFR